MPKPAPASPFVQLAQPYPRNRVELAQWFGSEDRCLDYLDSLRWADGFTCPKCDGHDSWRTSPGVRRCKSCRRRVSVTAGTLFQDTRKPLSAWFEALWHVCGQKNGGSALSLQRALGLGCYETAWAWLHRMRQAMVCPGRNKLDGEVEVDEAFIGGVKTGGGKGRASPGKTLVLVAVEVRGTTIGRARLQVIPDATAATLIPATMELIEPGSDVVTDGWASYAGLPKHGYNHVVSRPTPKVGDNVLPHAHRVIALLKRWLLGTHQGAVSHERLQSYLDEFVFRFNRRASRFRGLLFYRLLQQAIAHAPITQESISNAA